MRYEVFALSLTTVLLGGCERAVNTFTIDDPKRSVTSAELSLCDSHVKLSQSNHQFGGKVIVTCEGEGEIVVIFSNGARTSCHIEYVSPGLKQDFEFVMESGQCQPKI